MAPKCKAKKCGPRYFDDFLDMENIDPEELSAFHAEQSNRERRYTLPNIPFKQPPVDADIGADFDDSLPMDQWPRHKDANPFAENFKITRAAKEIIGEAKFSALTEQQIANLCRELAKISPSLEDSFNPGATQCSKCRFPGHNAATHDKHAAWRKQLFNAAELERDREEVC